MPEAVELPGRKVRKGDKVRVLPPRGERRTVENDRLWRVTSFEQRAEVRTAKLAALDDSDVTTASAADDLVVVAEFRDPIYPGLVSTGKVERGGDKPFHTVINAENFHALQTLLFTHRGKVDCIYIDPPYNTGAKDWKYNNNYVEEDDHYRHSKWLAFMERRLLVAKDLLNPDDSVLIVTIDQCERSRLGLLLEQVFPDGNLEMITSVINPRGKYRANSFARCEEYLFVLTFGDAVVLGEPDEDYGEGAFVPWRTFRRSDLASRRGSKKGGTAQFYPIYVNASGCIHSIGEAIPYDVPRESVPTVPGCSAVFPIRKDGTEMNWGLTRPAAEALRGKGYLRVGRHTPKLDQKWEISYLTSGRAADIDDGRAEIVGYNADGSVRAQYVTGKVKMPVTTWVRESHNAETHGTEMLKNLLGEKLFDYPKSLYAVEDALRLFLADRPQAVVLDFFAGSGTTTHATMRLNSEDGGYRQSISVTNNEIGPTDEERLTGAGFRAGDKEWDNLGIFEKIATPRLKAVVTGHRTDGTPVPGEYQFGSKEQIRSGLDENVEFLNLTYESPLRISSSREFAKISALLWLRAGSQGRRIERLPNGWEVAETYGVISDLDKSDQFVEAVSADERVQMAFIVTNEDRLFEAIVAELPDHAEPVRLYESYLRNFEIEAGRSVR